MSSKAEQKKFCCEICGFASDKKHHYQAHLRSNKHIRNKQVVCGINSSVPNFNSSMSLLDEIRRLRAEVENLQGLYSEISTLKSQIRQLVCLSNVSNANVAVDNRQVINNLNSTTNININIRPFGNENWDYLTNREIVPIMKAVNTCLPELVKKIHFDVNHPENHNIKIPNKKENRISIFDGVQWTTQQKNEIMETLISNLIHRLDDFKDDFEKESTLFIQNLWKEKVGKLINVNDENNELKKSLKIMRDKLECSILDSQRKLRNINYYNNLSLT